MSQLDTQSLTERLQSFVGTQARPPQVARDPVNEAMIRHWCDAVGDTNPVYTDPELAAQSVHGGIVAPPTMLQAWSMRGLEPGSDGRGPGAASDDLIDLLDRAGFTSVVATNCEQEYARYLRPGDVVTVTSIVESVSDEKQTGLGVGHFVTTLATFTDQHGEALGTMRFRLLKFKPKNVPTAAPRAKRPRPPINLDNAFFWEGVDAGELRIQRCGPCGLLRHPPGPMCPSCRSLEWDFVVSSGRGRVYSFVVPHYPQVQAFDYPYVVALVELEEGTRLVTNLVDIDPADVAIGLPVEVQFVAVDNELTLPLFRVVPG